VTGALPALLGIASLDPAIVERITAFAVSNRHWALPLVFVTGLLKSTPVIAIFIPSTAMFVALAAAYSAGGGTFAPLWLAAAFGATTGDAVFYALGHRYRHGIARVWPVSQAPELLARGEELFARWGVWSVLGAKFIWGVRPFIPAIAGMYRMPFLIFLAATNLSSLIWAAIGMGAGFGLWRLWS
jgi:membrane protein DedA with SNARE-associated domain